MDIMIKKTGNLKYLTNFDRANMIEANRSAGAKIAQLQDEIQVMNNLMHLKDKYITALEKDLYRVVSGVTFEL